MGLVLLLGPACQDNAGRLDERPPPQQRTVTEAPLRCAPSTNIRPFAPLVTDARPWTVGPCGHTVVGRPAGSDVLFAPDLTATTTLSQPAVTFDRTGEWLSLRYQGSDETGYAVLNLLDDRRIDAPGLTFAAFVRGWSEDDILYGLDDDRSLFVLRGTTLEKIDVEMAPCSSPVTAREAPVLASPLADGRLGIIDLSDGSVVTSSDMSAVVECGSNRQPQLWISNDGRVVGVQLTTTIQTAGDIITTEYDPATFVDSLTGQRLAEASVILSGRAEDADRGHAAAFRSIDGSAVIMFGPDFSTRTLDELPLHIYSNDEQMLGLDILSTSPTRHRLYLEQLRTGEQQTLAEGFFSFALMSDDERYAVVSGTPPPCLAPNGPSCPREWLHYQVFEDGRFKYGLAVDGGRIDRVANDGTLVAAGQFFDAPVSDIASTTPSSLQTRLYGPDGDILAQWEDSLIYNRSQTTPTHWIIDWQIREPDFMGQVDIVDRTTFERRTIYTGANISQLRVDARGERIFLRNEDQDTVWAGAVVPSP